HFFQSAQITMKIRLRSRLGFLPTSAVALFSLILVPARATDIYDGSLILYNNYGPMATFSSDYYGSTLTLSVPQFVVDGSLVTTELGATHALIRNDVG